MPNWCFNETVFYGEEEVLKKFKDDLEDAISDNPKFQKVENGWDNMWLGNLFLEAGYSEEDVTNGNIHCRGGILSVADVNGGVAISYESAWGPIIESLDKMLREKYKGLKQVTLAEEPGEGVYVNTDIEGIYFPEKYYFDYEDENGMFNDEKYFYDEEGVVNAFNEGFKTNFKSFDECYKYINEMDGDRYVCLEAFC